MGSSAMRMPCLNGIVHLDKLRSSLFREAASGWIRAVPPFNSSPSPPPDKGFLIPCIIADSIIEDGTLAGRGIPAQRGSTEAAFKVGRTLTSVLHQSSAP